ncbi:uncharacterized methyltransferase YdaC-like isoform X2 [Antennarius striatus]|uniref:uncharacterized methyltransferase YdaC-like isoform X2 n=1 Tax=Antennarius striatus TaxID=241820 RepID=UPI0035B0261C
MLAKEIGKHLSCPRQSVTGWMVSIWLRAHNRNLEASAVQLVGVQPDDTVLEVGHGPGLGLQSAAKLLTGPTGHIIGVDYSEYMHQMTRKQLKNLVVSGKLTLHLCDVAAMPLADHTVDKVFHCNSYYYWLDLKKAATEIHRVMKPGGLMVTTLYGFHVAKVASKVLPGDNWRPEKYMAALSDSSFTNIRMEDKKHGDKPFQAIYANA